jgi:hypothetical protein
MLFSLKCCVQNSEIDQGISVIKGSLSAQILGQTTPAARSMPLFAHSRFAAILCRGIIVENALRKTHDRGATYLPCSPSVLSP